MRITFICPYAGLTGGANVVAIYAHHLQAREHEVHVVSCPLPAPKLREKVKKWLGRTVADKPPPTPLLDALGVRHHVIDSCRAITGDDVPEADVVVATWWETAEWVAAMPASRGRKFYLLQGYEVFPHLPVERVIATYHLPLQKLAVSDFIRNEIERNHGVSDIMLVPNAVDAERFRTSPRARNTPPVVGFLYSTAAVKNIALAIAAMEAARARNPELQGLVFGSRPISPDLPLPDWIRYEMQPSQDRIPEIYAACDMWLFTSTQEGFGLPLLEAMASGTPVLATRAGAAPDLVVDGQNGWLLDGTPEVFADAILRLADLPEADWQAFSAAARRTAERHDWEQATDRLEACLAGS